jgi:transposase
MVKKASKETQKQKQNVVAMQMVHEHAAGIDISDKEHVVAVPENVGKDRVRKFGAMTCDLQMIAEWLEECEITTVAMESTGVYWKPLFSVLVRAGFEVYLVNSKSVKNVSGRKTDEDDAMWIQKLHSCGLLKSSYLPDDVQDALRTLVRFRRSLLQDRSRFINRIQKALELMNIKFHTAISNIVGKTGTSVLKAIIHGERNAENFLPLIGKRIKADRETIIKSLEGNWREEHLFTLKQSYEMYQIYGQQIKELDTKIEKLLTEYEAKSNEGVIEIKESESNNNGINNDIKEEKPKKIKKAKDKNHPAFDVRGFLERIHGTDVLAIYGLSEISGLEILAETGTDLSRWENEAHFRAWLNLCPNNKISGGKLISSKMMKKKTNAASQAFRHAANAVQKSNHWLGDYFRRMKVKGGNKYAVLATAGKIATIYYKMVRYKEEFKPLDLEIYQQKYKLAKVAYLERMLKKLKGEAA